MLAEIEWFVRDEDSLMRRDSQSYSIEDMACYITVYGTESCGFRVAECISECGREATLEPVAASFDTIGSAMLVGRAMAHVLAHCTEGHA